MTVKVKLTTSVLDKKKRGRRVKIGALRMVNDI